MGNKEPLPQTPAKKGFLWVIEGNTVDHKRKERRGSFFDVIFFFEI